MNVAEAEVAIISAVLTHGSEALQSVPTLEPQHFFDERWRQVFAAALDIELSGGVVDAWTIAQRLHETNRLQQVGGSPALAEIRDCVPDRLEALSDLANRVREAYVLRRLRDWASAVQGRVDSVTDAKEFLSETMSGIERIMGELIGASQTEELVTTLSACIQLAREMADGKPPEFVSTGIPDLDEDIGGFRAGFVAVVGAPTNWGKSNYLLMVADAAMKAGKRMLIVSWEDDPNLYIRRLIVARSGVSAFRARQHRLSNDEWSRFTAASEEVSKQQRAPLLYNACGGLPVERVVARIARLSKEHQYDLVAFDYLTAASSSERHENVRARVNHVYRLMLDCAKQNHAAGIVVSQLARLEEGKQPRLESLKESGDIENGAETVLLGFKDQQGKPRLRLAKAKDAASGIDYGLHWNPVSCCLEPGGRLNGTSDEKRSSGKVHRPLTGDRPRDFRERAGNDD